MCARRPEGEYAFLRFSINGFVGTQLIPLFVKTYASLFVTFSRFCANLGFVVLQLLICSLLGCYLFLASAL